MSKRKPAYLTSTDVTWKGPKRPFDLLKEVGILVAVVLVLVVGLGLLVGGPESQAVTFKEWATNQPGDFYTTAIAELDGTSGTAGYGVPYQESTDAAQKYGPLCPACWWGMTYPIDTPNDFVINPLKAVSGDANLTEAISQWTAANADTQKSWTDAYTKALESVTSEKTTLPGNTGSADDLGLPVLNGAVPAGDYGPVGTLMDGLYNDAKSGGLDAFMTSGQGANQGTFYNLDYTKPLMFLADGVYYNATGSSNAAPRYAGYLGGDQWGVVNEVANWPGAWWLIPYSIWYQFGPGLNSDNGDLYVMILVGIFSFIILLIPFIPGLRDIPRWIPIYRIMWKDYYDLKKARK